MKSAVEVLEKAKGAGNATKTITGKGVFSKAGWEEQVHALVNDTGFNIKTLNPDGSVGQINISECIRNDIKKTIAAAGYPQKSEAGVIDTVEVCTQGLSKVVGELVAQQLETGKKFPLPPKELYQASIYIQSVPAAKKTVAAKNIQTGESLGTVEITTKDSIQLRAKSPVPKNLQTKVKRDTKGNIIK